MMMSVIDKIKEEIGLRTVKLAIEIVILSKLVWKGFTMKEESRGKWIFE